MRYDWTSDLETGNNTIDEQHKQLIAAINNLLEACSQGKGRDSLKETTTFLYNYTAKHFADEEKLQLASQYPDYPNHKQYHEGFKKVVREIMDQLEKEGPSLLLVSKVNSSIGGWLINHIKREDVKVAAHIRSKQ
ncbi:MAG: bacteriohemerythrin [Clostridiales bacterium]|jgi:hemerythrin|uniref:bacteriohemerythrin n=2 Tax=Aminipila sp. TaxID=2060095 RepID=UPI001DC32C76|nr:hemerythrin family protein [Aminipila sp.]MBE6035959.1 bacteriohemerythrin [Clostridiales bacterium]